MASSTSDADLEAGGSIKHTVKFLLDCKEKGRDFGNKPPPSIFMIPGAYRDLSPKSFTPTVVSIGPLHREDKILQGFEVEKMSFLHRLLDRCSASSVEKMLQECVEKVSMKIKVIRECYAESVTYNDEELTRMMVVDACFILDFCHFLSEDEVFPGSYLTFTLIAFDLLLIENQIPFFVLKDIFDITILPFKLSTSLNEHIISLLVFYDFFDKDIKSSASGLDSSHDHILSLLHKSLQPENNNNISFESTTNYSVTELDRAGVHFKPNEDVNWPMSMKLELPRFPWFWCKPTLRMPKLSLHDDTELVLKNLIMYEQFCHDRVPSYVISYVMVMDSLIDTPEDVAKLVQSGVLDNNIGSNEEAANMINNLGKKVTDLRLYYNQEWQQLHAYYNRYWPNLVAGLKRTYFSNPWTMIALFAAIILFVLTVVQTIFQIKTVNL